jgi:ribulose-phosphate 3-epimerase
MAVMANSSLETSASLWSADLSRLAEEVKRADPHTTMYHIDVSDGSYAEGVMLFFPDLVAAIRKETMRPLEVHLIMRNPEAWLDAFADAGADIILFYPDTTDDIGGMLDRIEERGIKPGISLAIEHPVELIEDYLHRLEIVCVLGTGFDVKGIDDVVDGTCEKIERLVAIREQAKHSYRIESDGAIRRHTVPKLRRAGTDVIVPGSLMFKEDMSEISSWLKTL